MLALKKAVLAAELVAFTVGTVVCGMEPIVLATETVVLAVEIVV